MLSHLCLPNRPFLDYKIASRHIHQAAVTPGAMARVTLEATAVFGLNGVKQDKEQESEGEECRATEEQEKVVQVLGQPAAGGPRQKVC